MSENVPPGIEALTEMIPVNFGHCRIPNFSPHMRTSLNAIQTPLLDERAYVKLPAFRILYKRDIEVHGRTHAGRRTRFVGEAIGSARKRWLREH